MELVRFSTEISTEFSQNLNGVCMIRIELGYKWFKDLGWRLARGWLEFSINLNGL